MDKACFFCGAAPVAWQISVPVGLSLAFRSACQQGGDAPDPAWRQSVLKEVMAKATSRMALASGSKTPATGVCAECRAILEAPPPATAPLPVAQPIQVKRKGCAVLVAFTLSALVIAIGIMSLPGDRFPAFWKETGAIRAIQRLHAAQMQYYAQHGKYANTLAELGRPASGAARLAYQFTFATKQGGYTINAHPVHFGSDVNRTFFSDQSMVIRQNFGPEPATADSPELR